MTEPEKPDPDASSAALLQLVEGYERALQEGRVDDADAIALDTLAFAVQHAQEDPSSQLLLLQQAQQREGDADWNGAEAIYQKLLDEAVAAGDAANEYRAHTALSGLARLLGDKAAALEQARSSIAAARRMDLSIVVAMALEQHADCALRFEAVAEALASVDEALKLMTSENKMYDLQRGRCLLLRAECALASGDSYAAERDVDFARQALEAQSRMEIAAGVHSTVARWWAVMAGLHALQGDLEAAERAWEKSVAGRRHVAALPHVAGPYAQSALAEALRSQGRAALAAGRRPEAEEAFAESRAIRAEIGLPPVTYE